MSSNTAQFTDIIKNFITHFNFDFKLVIQFFSASFRNPKLTNMTTGRSLSSVYYFIHFQIVFHLSFDAYEKIVRNFEACFHRDYHLLLGWSQWLKHMSKEKSFTSFHPIKKKYNGKTFFIDSWKRWKMKVFPRAQAKSVVSLKNYSLVQEIIMIACRALLQIFKFAVVAINKHISIYLSFWSLINYPIQT